MTLSETERGLILDLASRRINLEEFYRRYPHNIQEDSHYVARLIREAAESRNAAQLELALYLRGYHSRVESLDTHAGILRQILPQTWHKQHELIVDALHSLYDEESVEALLGELQTDRSYLGCESQLALHRKCVFALADLGTPEALQALEAFAVVREGPTAKLAREELAQLTERDPKNGSTDH